MTITHKSFEIWPTILQNGTLFLNKCAKVAHTVFHPELSLLVQKRKMIWVCVRLPYLAAAARTTQEAVLCCAGAGRGIARVTPAGAGATSGRRCRRLLVPGRYGHRLAYRQQIILYTGISFSYH